MAHRDQQQQPARHTALRLPGLVLPRPQPTAETRHHGGGRYWPDHVHRALTITACRSACCALYAVPPDHCCMAWFTLQDDPPPETVPEPPAPCAWALHLEQVMNGHERGPVPCISLSILTEHCTAPCQEKRRVTRHFSPRISCPPSPCPPRGSSLSPSCRGYSERPRHTCPRPGPRPRDPEHPIVVRLEERQPTAI